MRHHAFAITPILLAAAAASAAGQQQEGADWPNYGRDAGGSRYSPLKQITRKNVSQLAVAWTFHTGEGELKLQRGGSPALETTPILVDGTLYVTTPLGRVIALDPSTGTERWRFDAKINVNGGYGDFANRGVSTWRDRSATTGEPCARRIMIATIDARLIALDAKDGALCEGFGTNGTINLRLGLRLAPFEFSAYEETSPPLVVNDLVVVGSAIADNSRAAPASGEVRAFDARSGKLLWTWHPIPQSASDPAFSTWEDSSAARTGAANAWSALVADAERDLVFVPTSSAAPDYFGGLRKGSNRYANSVVALRASTGQMVWNFQTVHHDLWDYDNASPPALATVTKDGRSIPAVIQTTKTGMMFILNRETGEPLFPVEERRVPASDLPDEAAWPTQPFTTVTPPLVPHRLTEDDVWGSTPAERDACLAQLHTLRNEGIFTPPSSGGGGTLAIPSNIGGAHWGGVAIDAGLGIAVVPVNRLAAIVQLLPNAQYDPTEARKEIDRWGYEYTRMRGTPYVMRRRLFMSPGGLPCTKPPFGALIAVSLSTGRKLWDVPLGTVAGPDGKPVSPSLGSPNLGGPIVTAGGLVFIGATLDRAFHAFDVESGREVWTASLPAGARATPMTYQVNGRQYVVIAAGGGGRFGAGDSIVAFALPAPAP
ncbi:MAG: pyrroloquinoline quinone-dependent dehydrogenase [Gemmatimonadaceae bacterium]